MSDQFGNIDYQRVKRHYDYDDYAAIAFNAAGGAEVRYIAGTNAFLAGGLPPPTSNILAVGDPTIPMFEAKSVVLIPTVDCYVRFEPDYRLAPGQSTRIQWFIQFAFAPFTIPRRFTALHVIGAVGAGVLHAYILG